MKKLNEICIESEKLLLQTPDIEILKRRLKEENFYEKVLINGFLETIHFPSDWPGNALEIYPSEIERKQKNPDILPFWTYIIIAKETKTVVGGICCKSKPNERNEVEIGYGINISEQKKGYASEAVLMLISYLFNNTVVSTVTAESGVENKPSIRVLQKNGFIKTGNRFDEEDGYLITWKKNKKDSNIKPYDLLIKGIEDYTPNNKTK